MTTSTPRLGFALAPSVGGTSIYSRNTDVAIDSDMALAWQVGVSGSIPLLTFGKIANAWEAADANLTVGQQELTKAKQEVMLDVRRAYYGLQFARDALCCSLGTRSGASTSTSGRSSDACRRARATRSRC
jgi:hypothetical protein